MAEAPSTPASKRDAVLALLDRGMVMLHLDARRDAVSVPSFLGREAHLRLNLSYRFLLDDLVIDENGVQATLSFRGEPHLCKVPWPALFAVTRSGTDEGWLWPNDLPAELMQGAVEASEVGPAPSGAPQAQPQPQGHARPMLRAIPLEESGQDTGAPRAVPTAAPTEAERDDGGDDGAPRPPPFLRLVK